MIDRIERAIVPLDEYLGRGMVGPMMRDFASSIIETITEQVLAAELVPSDPRMGDAIVLLGRWVAWFHGWQEDDPGVVSPLADTRTFLEKTS